MTQLDKEGQYDHPKVQRLYDYWKFKSKGAKLPARRDIDPVDIPDLLSCMVLMDVLREEQQMRFRIRLAGTIFCEVHHRDITGEWVDEMIGREAGRDVTQNHEIVVKTKRPHFWRNHLHMEGRRHIGYQRLFCPLASDGETVDTLIGYFAFDEAGSALSGRLWRYNSMPLKRPPSL